MASSSSSSQARSIVSAKQYDVFISHRGPDVKETLAKQLYDLLRERGCRAFLDLPEIEAGDSITSAIHNAICSSRVQIAIFSKGYAQSKWCLDELVLMLAQTDALFIPVFYGVEPMELRSTDRGAYAEAFSYYQSKEKYIHKVTVWKEALTSAADVSGYEHRQLEDNLCEKIVSRVVQVVQEKKKSIPLDVAKYPVGLAELVQDFERCCSRTAGVVGIFGLGGSGKTTLAKELFNRKRSGYTESCFLSDVRESHTRGELHWLQSQLLKDLFPREPEIQIRSVHHGIGGLKDHLGRAKHLHFLIILDDIDHQDQLDALLPEGMLGYGSLVIITTRDRSVLRGADIRYKMKGMEKDHAKDLFCSHAFRGQDPPIAYVKLVESFVKFCGGLPLSLIVLGAHLYYKDEYYWELELEKVQNIQPKDIMQRLKISFDSLDSQEKQIFIDIACFFNNTKNLFVKRKAIRIWNASGWSAEHAVQTLQDKSLVEISIHDNFRMHDHLRDLGRRMADDLAPPRLWKPNILRSMEAKGLQQILAETKVRCFLEEFVDSSLQALFTCFIGCPNDSSKTEVLGLEISGWLDYQEEHILENIPSWIPLRKLQYLSVKNIRELWITFQQQTHANTQASFDLRSLKISRCPSLQKLPDMIGMFSHLKELDIFDSLQKTDIRSFVQSLEQLSNLKSLRLWQEDREEDTVLFKGSLNLSKGGDSNGFEASTSSRLNKLKTISLHSLCNISKLVISRDTCPGHRSLDVFWMENLNEMNLKELERLNTLEVIGCPKLKRISGLSTLTGLQSFRVWDCSTFKTVSGLSSLTGLQSLKVGKYPKLETLSELSSLPGLQVFETEECEELKSLPSLAHQRHLERIKISHCLQLQNVEGFEELQGLKSLIIEVPDRRYRYGWIRNCIYGLRRLPSEFTVVVGKAVDGASFRLNVELFSEVISSQAVVEMTGEKYSSYYTRSNLRRSSSAITIYTWLLESNSSLRGKDNPYLHPYAIGPYYSSAPCFPSGCEWMITVLQTQHDSGEGRLKNDVRIKKGIKATVDEGEEDKALALLQRIFDRLYREGIAVADVATDVSQKLKL